MMRDQDRAKIRWTGNPVRQKLPIYFPRALCAASGGWPINLLIFGGSQGAAFADLIPAALNHLPEKIKSRLRNQQVRPISRDT